MLDWPYIEGLAYGRSDAIRSRSSPPAFTANRCRIRTARRLRLVTPWKYGFKGIKAIVNIRFTDKQPVNTVAATGSAGIRFLRERESECRPSAMEPGPERRIGEFFKRPTLMFNGYADQVAELYTGMDLRKNY